LLFNPERGFLCHHHHHRHRLHHYGFISHHYV
jgi:hypothetical protein